MSKRFPLPGIYKITSPTGRVYIGQSNDIERRFKTYAKLQRKRIGTGIYNSLVKYGVKAHRFEIVHLIGTMTSDNLIREALNDAEIMFIKTMKENGYRMLNMTDGGSGSYGYKHSKETIDKLKELGTGSNSGMAKPVLQYDLNGNFLKEFPAIASAAKEVGVSVSSITQVMKGICKKSGGYYWKFKIDKHNVYRTNTTS